MSLTYISLNVCFVSGCVCAWCGRTRASAKEHILNFIPCQQWAFAAVDVHNKESFASCDQVE